MQDLIDSLLLLYPQSRLVQQADGLWLEAAGMDVVAMAQRLAACEAHLSTVTAAVRPDGETDLIYHYRLGSTALNIKTRTQGNAMLSITLVNRAAGWIEREIQDLYAVTFTGHPNPARLIRPPELAAGFFRELGGKNTAPGGKNTAPGGKNTAPGGEDTAQGGKNAVLSGKNTAPGGEDTARSGENAQKS